MLSRAEGAKQEGGSLDPGRVILRACGVSSTPRPLDSITGISGILDRPLSRATTTEISWKHTFAFPRRNAPGSCIIFPPRKRAWGMPGARCTRSRAWSVVNTRVSHHGRTGITRHSRTRMVLTVSFALSPVIGLVCHRHLADTSAKLDAGVEASGPHDFAVRERLPQKHSTALVPVPPKFLGRRISAARLAPPPRPPHPVPTSVTIAKRPSEWDGMAGNMDVIWGKGEGKYFCRHDWTGSISLIRFRKLVFRRKVEKRAMGRRRHCERKTSRSSSDPGWSTETTGRRMMGSNGWGFLCR
jgi:hypothetical protein